MSVRETTPVSLPLILIPGYAEIPGGENAAVEKTGDAEGSAAPGGGTATAGVIVGVGGALFAGLGVSTIHILWMKGQHMTTS